MKHFGDNIWLEEKGGELCIGANLSHHGSSMIDPSVYLTKSLIHLSGLQQSYCDGINCLLCILCILVETVLSSRTLVG